MVGESDRRRLAAAMIAAAEPFDIDQMERDTRLLEVVMNGSSMSDRTKVICAAVAIIWISAAGLVSSLAPDTGDAINWSSGSVAADAPGWPKNER